MCGIIGWLNKEGEIHLPEFDSMRDTLAHRGPDGAGSRLFQSGKVALGHRRLSFLDLGEGGSQPMACADDRFHLTFNGEIYNYKEVRQILESKGYTFRSESDTEVLLVGYKALGKGILPLLKGMFAFGIWDNEAKKLFLARDRFGIKPLYYYQTAKGFLFASEIKGIQACPSITLSLDLTALTDYLTYRFVPSPRSIWREVSKLPPAHSLEYDFNTGNARIEEYWSLEIGDKRMARKDAVRKVDELLSRSVREHLRSDVPIGTFLSGGYDSSALAYYMVRENYSPTAYSIGFDAWNDSEHFQAKTVADHLGIPLEVEMAGNEQLGLMPKLAHHYDEPFADISIIPTIMVSGLAAQSVKAVFSGEGADEMFGGYWWQKKIAKQGAMSRKDLLEDYAEAMSMGRMDSGNLKEYLPGDLLEAARKDSYFFYDKHIKEDEVPLNAFRYMDAKSFMGELVLTKVDRATMAYSLEARVPFLDHELVEFMFSLSPSVFYDEKKTKFLLRENIKQHLPPSILKRKKQGFVGPDKYYGNTDWYVECLSNGHLIKNKILNRNALLKMVVTNDIWRLWKFCVLEFWWDKNNT